MVEIPADFDVVSNALAFDPKQVRTGYNADHRVRKDQTPWATAPSFVNDLPYCALDLVNPAQ